MMMKTQINGGSFKCTFCKGPFREERYFLEEEDFTNNNRVHPFCLPECLVAWDWEILGRNSESPEDQQYSKQLYREKFQRAVFPAPYGAFTKTERRPREQWLKEDCHDPLIGNPEDYNKAKRELYCNSRETVTLKICKQKIKP